MAIAEIAHTLDEASFPDLDALRARYGWAERTHRTFERLFALRSTALHEGSSLGANLERAARKLLARRPELAGRVDLVVYAHALHATTPVDHAALEGIAERVFGGRPEALSATFGSCASAIMALRMLEEAAEGGPRTVVLLTGEKCFFELLNYADNNGLFGEVASAVLVRPGSRSGARVAGSCVGAFPGVSSPVPKLDREVAAAYDRDFMPRILASIETTLSRAGVGPREIDAILPTHLSPATCGRVARALGIPDERVFRTNLPRIGHCYCGDLFINYESWVSQDRERAARGHAVLSFAAGMTGSYASILLSSEPER